MVERTLSSFPKFLSEGIGNLVSPVSQSKCLSPGPGKGFEIFLHTIHSFQTKYEQDQLINKELNLIQQKISAADVTQAQIRDYLCRAIYCGMLGYDVSFAYIHAVKLAQQGTLLEKRIGYLAASLLLHPGHELVLLLVNTIQKDLKSSNILENCMALTAASQLIGSEMIPALLPMVLDKLKHSRELVRQKAVTCLYRFQLLAPDLLAHVHTDLERALFDKDPGVMAAAVNIVSHNIQQDPTKYLHLVNTLISILQQVMTGKMSAMFEYHSVPFPWLQIKLLRCLGNLGAADELTQMKLSPLMIEVLQRASSKENIAYALIYECLVCISSIKPEKQVMEEASRHVRRFIRSSDNNLRYVGVKALIGLVKVDPYFVTDYQNMIVECLEHSDQSIQRKMYKLLYQIANPTNVEVICNKLLGQLESSLDKFWRSEVISMVMDLTKKFSPTVTWQYETKLRCLQLGGNNVSSSDIDSIILDMKTGCCSSNVELKQYLVKKCIECLMANKSHPNVINVTAWTLSELSSMLTKLPEDRVISLYTRHLCSPDLPDAIKACLVTCLQKLMCASVISKDTMATKLLECLKCKHSALIRQRITLLYQVCKLGLKIRLSQDPDQFDFTLSFLDGYLSQRIEQGARPYKPRHLRLGTKLEGLIPQVSETAAAPSVKSGEKAESAYFSSQYKTESSTSSGRNKEESEAKLNLSAVKKVWGKEGIINKNQEPKTSELQSEITNDSGQTEGQLQRQQMAAALFSGLVAQGTEKECYEAGIQNVTNFGASDQDMTTFLPSKDIAGWRSYSRNHPSLDENIALGAEGTSVDSSSLERTDEENENKSGIGTHGLQSLSDFQNVQTMKFDTGYETKVGLDDCYEAHETLGAKTFEVNPDLDMYTENNENISIHNDNLFKNPDLNDFVVTNQDRTNDLTCVAAIPKSSASHEVLLDVKQKNEQEETPDKNDLDEALSMLLNDSSNFINLSVVSQDQSSDSSNSGNHSGVTVRESLYSYKQDKTVSDVNTFGVRTVQTGEVEEKLRHIDDEASKGSLYDDDDDIKGSLYDDDT